MDLQSAESRSILIQHPYYTCGVATRVTHAPLQRIQQCGNIQLKSKITSYPTEVFMVQCNRVALVVVICALI